MVSVFFKTASSLHRKKRKETIKTKKKMEEIINERLEKSAEKMMLSLPRGCKALYITAIIVGILLCMAAIVTTTISESYSLLS